MKKSFILFFTILLAIGTLTGCKNDKKETDFYSTLNNILSIDGNANNIELKVFTDDKEFLGEYKEYADLIKNKEQEYVLNLKMDAIRSDDNKKVSADIYYQIADMEEYKILSDIVLEDNILYVNGDSIIQAVKELYPEYKLAISTFFRIDSEYLKFDVSDYLDSNLIMNEEVINSFENQIIRFMNDTFKDIESSVIIKDDDNYRIEVNKENVDQVNSSLLKSLDNAESYYDGFINDLESEKVDTKQKEKFLRQILSVKDELIDNSKELEAFKSKNSKITLEPEIQGEVGRIKFSKVDNENNLIQLDYSISSNKKADIKIPSDADELDSSVWEFFKSIF